MPIRSQPVVYCIDSRDRITRVNREWGRFACANGAEHLARRAILGSSLWDHITDSTTGHLYRIFVNRVRGHRRRVSVPFRCDSADTRRFLELHLEPMADDSIRFVSVTLKLEKRAPVGLLAPAVQNKAPLVKVCSWCKRVATPKWVQAEQAVAKLGLFELEPPPGITHGICDDCHRQALQQMD